jgi:hypothetical protein
MTSVWLFVALLASAIWSAASALAQTSRPPTPLLAAQPDVDLQSVHLLTQQLRMRMGSVEVKLNLAKPQAVVPPTPEPKTLAEAIGQLDALEQRVARAEADAQRKAKGAWCSADGGKTLVDPVRGITWQCGSYRCIDGPPAQCPDSCKKASDCQLGHVCVVNVCK